MPAEKLSLRYGDHDLSKWLKYGGLPCHVDVSNKYIRESYCLLEEGRIMLTKEGFCLVNINGMQLEWWQDSLITPRYSTLEDVRSLAPEACKVIFEVDSSGMGGFFVMNGCWTKYIQHHLFDPEVYYKGIIFETEGYIETGYYGEKVCPKD